MKQLKWFLRVVVVGFWGYCVYAAFPFSFDTFTNIELNAVAVIGTLTAFIIISLLIVVVVGLIIFGVSWIFED